MDQAASRRGISRRSALKLLAATGATTAGGYLLYESASWLNYEQQTAPTWRPIDAGVPAYARKRELVRYATLAANGHNAQAWHFTIAEDAITIHPDAARRLPVVGIDDRELWISLGCALENLLVAARTLGYEAAVTYPDLEDGIRIQLAPAAAARDPLFDAIPLRQTTCSGYDGQSIPSAELGRLQALPLEPGVTLHLITDPTGGETVLEYVNQGNLRQYGDPAFVDELIGWLRFNKREALESLDGLPSRCSGNPEVPRWLGQLVVARTEPQQQADADAKKLRSSPAAVVIGSASDTRANWVRTG